MIFVNNKSFGIVSDNFLNNKYIGYANLGSVFTKLGNTPSDSTGIDEEKKMAFLKCYQEHLERRKIGFQVDTIDKIRVLNYIDKKLYTLNKSSFGYGDNSIFGNIDTTGTASGLRSKEITNTAILELIEKNEMLLFWYLCKGFYIEKDYLVKKMISKLGFSSERIEIFSCNKLSNYFTFFVILISDNTIVASGAGISNCEVSALDKALNEARLLEWQNKNNVESDIYNMDYKEKKEILNYVDYLISILPQKVLQKNTIKFLILEDWIKTIFIHVLNPINDYSSLTIKCISKELYNCIPLKNNIRKYINKEIAIKYGLTKDILEKTPNCILK